MTACHHGIYIIVYILYTILQAVFNKKEIYVQLLSLKIMLLVSFLVLLLL